MKRYVSSQELSQNIQAVLYDIHHGSDPIFIKDDFIKDEGRVQAVVVSADFFTNWQEKLRKDFFLQLNTMGKKLEPSGKPKVRRKRICSSWSIKRCKTTVLTIHQAGGS